MRVYLSGPITGVKDFKKKFKYYQEKLEEHGYDVVNPAKLGGILPEDFSHADFMTICIALLNTCDAIYFMPGTERSAGAQSERIYAAAMNKPDITGPCRIEPMPKAYK